MTAMRKFKSDAFEAVHSAAAGMDRAGTIEKWETRAKKPSGAALRLLSIVQKHGLQILTWPMFHRDAGGYRPSRAGRGFFHPDRAAIARHVIDKG